MRMKSEAKRRAATRQSIAALHVCIRCKYGGVNWPDVDDFPQRVAREKLPTAHNPTA
jgi:hypothetical protein